MTTKLIFFSLIIFSLSLITPLFVGSKRLAATDVHSQEEIDKLKPNQNITEINISGPAISSIDSLTADKFSNLKKLTIVDVAITSLPPLTGFKQLTHLKLDWLPRVSVLPAKTVINAIKDNLEYIFLKLNNEKGTWGDSWKILNDCGLSAEEFDFNWVSKDDNKVEATVKNEVKTRRATLKANAKAKEEELTRNCLLIAAYIDLCSNFITNVSTTPATKFSNPKEIADAIKAMGKSVRTSFNSLKASKQNAAEIKNLETSLSTLEATILTVKDT